MSRPAHTQEDILSALSKGHLLSAGELQEKLGVNKTSVYRALEKLLSDEKVCKHLLGDEQVVYELRDHHHDHLVCERCGDITTVSCQTNAPASVSDFSVSHHHTTFFGICKKCCKSC